MEGRDFFESAVWWWRPLRKILGANTRLIKTPAAAKREFFPKHVFENLKFAESATGLDDLYRAWFMEELSVRLGHEGGTWPGYLFGGDELRKKMGTSEAPGAWSDELRARELLGKVDLLFTNPPFGSKIPVNDPAILEQYDLGHTWNYDKEADVWVKTDAVQKSQPPEILFIERCVKFLKPGSGRAAMVLPDGILGSPGLGYVREWILRNCRILASIDLHPDTFQPFVSIQTSLLVLERKTEELIAVETASGQINDYSVFMAIANHVGHDKRGNTNYVRDRKGNEIVEEVVTQVKEYDDGTPVLRHQKVRKKVVDDNTPQIAQHFRQWFLEQN